MTRDLFILWTTSEQAGVIAETSTEIPDYLRRQAISRAGRPARGRLWIDESLPEETKVDPWPDNDLSRKLGATYGGIVVRAEDLAVCMLLPGIVTDLQLNHPVTIAAMRTMELWSRCRAASNGRFQGSAGSVFMIDGDAFELTIAPKREGFAFVETSETICRDRSFDELSEQWTVDWLIEIGGTHDEEYDHIVFPVPRTSTNSVTYLILTDPQNATDSPWDLRTVYDDGEEEAVMIAEQLTTRADVLKLMVALHIRPL